MMGFLIYPNPHLKQPNTHFILSNLQRGFTFVSVGYLCDFFINTPSAMMGCLIFVVKKINYPTIINFVDIH